MDMDTDAKFERLIETLRSHDGERRQELAHLRLQNQMMQAELSKRNQQVQSLQQQIQKLTEFKRSILRSVKDPSFGEELEFAGAATTGASYDDVTRNPASSGAFEGGAGAGAAQADEKDFVDGREFFMVAQRELPKEVYKQFLQVISDYNKANVASLPFEQVRSPRLPPS